MFQCVVGFVNIFYILSCTICNGVCPFQITRLFTYIRRPYLLAQHIIRVLQIAQLRYQSLLDVYSLYSCLPSLEAIYADVINQIMNLFYTYLPGLEISRKLWNQIRLKTNIYWSEGAAFEISLFIHWLQV